MRYYLQKSTKSVVATIALFTLIQACSSSDDESPMEDSEYMFSPTSQQSNQLIADETLTINSCWFTNSDSIAVVEVVSNSFEPSCNAGVPSEFASHHSTSVLLKKSVVGEVPEQFDLRYLDTSQLTDAEIGKELLVSLYEKDGDYFAVTTLRAEQATVASSSDSVPNYVIDLPVLESELFAELNSAHSSPQSFCTPDEEQARLSETAIVDSFNHTEAACGVLNP